MIPIIHPDGLFFEDLEVGRCFDGGPIEVEPQEIISFAERFDPQIFHTDPQAAEATLFGAHVASGWHTAGLSMRLMVLSAFRPAGGIVGRGVRDMQWPKPAFPGDRLRLRVTITGLRPSQSKPDQGRIDLTMQTRNQRDAIVFEAQPTLIVPRRR
ncbi:MAG: MaoC family dehydratase [Pseudomonadota bacterium]